MTPSAQSHSLNRAASTLSHEATTIPAIFDIFDAPARLIDDDAETYLPENFRSPKHYIPSPFCPPSSAISSPSSASSSNTSPSLSSVASSSRLLSYTSPVILFDGPAHPSRPIIVTTRHRNSSSLASSGSSITYSPPEPIIFDGPSRPRRRGPAAMAKSEVGQFDTSSQSKRTSLKSLQVGSLSQALAAVTAVAGIVLYQLYGQPFTPKKRLSSEKHLH